MKKTLLIALIAASSAAGFAHAQMQPQPGFGPAEAAGPGLRMVEELGLDEYQAEEIAAIFEEARALHQIEHEKSLETHDAIKMETHAAVGELLSEQQQIRFQELQQLRAERWTNGPGNRQGKGGGQKGNGDGVCNGTGNETGSVGGGPEGNGTGAMGNGNGPKAGPGECTGLQDCTR
jgi:hypothetical protein